MFLFNLSSTITFALISYIAHYFTSQSFLPPILGNSLVRIGANLKVPPTTTLLSTVSRVEFTKEMSDGNDVSFAIKDS